MADTKQETVTEVQQQEEKLQEKKNELSRANWADQVDDDEEDQEIGIQGDQNTAEGKNNKKGYKKDRKANWKKGQQLEEKKVFNPPVPRQKTDRGDYVVTSFSIPDRQATQEEKVC